MTDRTRTSQGNFRPIRSDTKVSTIEERYNIDLGVRSDTQMGNFLKKSGYPSLSKMLQDSK